MTPQEFKSQMERLIKTFGVAAYGDDRLQLIWSDMRTLSPDEFKKIVDEFIGDFRLPPVLKDFRDAVSRLRESNYRDLKSQQALDARNFFESKYTPSDKSWIVENIRRRLNGEISDDEYSQFMEVLKNAETRDK